MVVVGAKASSSSAPCKNRILPRAGAVGGSRLTQAGGQEGALLPLSISAAGQVRCGAHTAGRSAPTPGASGSHIAGLCDDGARSAGGAVGRQTGLVGCLLISNSGRRTGLAGNSAPRASAFWT